MNQAVAISRPTITVTIVSKIGRRMARGLTLDQALVLDDPVTDRDEFEEVIKNSKVHEIAFRRAQAKYIDEALQDIEGGDQINGLKWQLERAHPLQFGTDNRPIVENNVNINGLPPDMVQAMRDMARKKTVSDVREPKIINATEC